MSAELQRLWNYAELTETAEKLIRINLQRAENATRGGDTRTALISRAQAFAAKNMWEILTEGHQQPGDYERMEMLLMSVTRQESRAD